MTHLLFIALSCRMMASAPPSAPQIVTPEDVVTPTDELAQPVEPVMDLPSTPSPQIEGITLFPNQGEVNPTAGFNDQRFGYVLHGEVQASYESNIFIQAHNAESDFIFRISPGLAVGLGDFKSEIYGSGRFRHQFEQYVGKSYVYVDYSPSYTWFASHGDQDTFDHNVRLIGELALKRITLGFRASYVTQNVPEEDIGTRVEQARVSAALTSNYNYSGKTSFDVNGYYESVDYDGNYVDTQEWRNEDWVNYRLSPKVTTGLGVAVGDVEQSSGPSQTYGRGLIRLKFEASDKLTVGITGGEEYRHTEDANGRWNGIFQMDLAWSVSDRTYLYLQAYRRANSSGTLGDDYYFSTGVALQFRQQIFHRFFFDLTAGYQNSDYQNPAGTAEFGRTDNLYFVRPGFGFDLGSWLNCQISAEYRKNDSTEDPRSFDAAIATVRFNVLF